MLFVADRCVFIDDFFAKMAPAAAPGECVEKSGQFDTFLGFASSQRFVKTPAYPDAVLLALLKTRLLEKQNVQKIVAPLRALW